MVCTHTGHAMHVVGHAVSSDSGIWAFIACILISISSGPLGIFLVLRRMTLMADGLSHGLLPGAALAGALFGHSLLALHIIGFSVALGLACITTWIAHRSRLGTDAVFSGFALWAMSAGLLIYQHCDHDMHLLTGSVSQIKPIMVGIMGIVACATTVFCWKGYRLLILSCFDPLFFRTQVGKPHRIEMLFLIVLTMNLMIAFQILGTLMGLGFVILPALTMRILSDRIPLMCRGAMAIGALSSMAGLMVLEANDRSGTVIVFIMGCVYGLALAYERFCGSGSKA
jgi:zinc/manganese transport system permease protein